MRRFISSLIVLYYSIGIIRNYLNLVIIVITIIKKDIDVHVFVFLMLY